MLYEIPTGPSQRVMTIALGPTTYTLRLAYADAPDGGWFMDLSDASGNPLACGVPLVTGADLLAQIPEVGVAGGLFVLTDRGGTAPTYAGMGTSAHLVFCDTASLSAQDDAMKAQFTPSVTIYSGAIGSLAIGFGQIGREV